MYRLEVVTPAGVVFSGENIYQTVINTADGEIGILENHMLLLTNVLPGKLRIEKEGGDVEEYAVTFGTIDITGDKVIVLVEEAYKIDEIDIEREKQLLEEAQENLNKEGLTEEERKRYEKQKFRAETLLNLAKVTR